MIKSKRDLQFNYLGYSFEELKDVVNSIEKYYYSFSKTKIDSSGAPKVKNGVIQKRILKPSKGKLRDIQNKIKDTILVKLPLPSCVKGGVKGQDTISNARVHKGNKYRFQTDLSKFFPSVSEDMVFQMFMDHGFSRVIARILSQLTTVDGELIFRKKSLPQGAPTSTHLANLVFAKVDFEILKLIEGKNIVYTRWVDDLTFSSKNPFESIKPDLIKIISANGLKINRKKTSQRTKRSVITGIDTGNNTLRVSKEFRDKENPKLSTNQITGRKHYADRVKKANQPSSYKQ